MRLAVIDLGTNTFHLLIAEMTADGGWQVVSRQKVYAKLAENGIEHIGPAAFSRALNAMQGFKAEVDRAGVAPDRVHALGTAALRTADNASDLIGQIRERTGIRVEVISGDREAALIHKGVREAVPFPAEGRLLIMDIGGGSVEFILADRERVFWQKSFSVGVAVLFREFQRHDPITAAEIETLERYLDSALSELWQALERWPAVALAGASGTFDVLDNFLLDPATKPPLYGRTTTEAFMPLCALFLRSSLAERRQMPALAPERVEMIVVAVVLVRQVLQRGQLTDIYTSTYAMKEGLLAEWLGKA